MRGAALPLLAACSVLALLCQTRAAEHYNAASCDKACTAGRCHFKDCERPTTCNGGLCLFENCVRPACNGGACTFVQCKHPSCNGGSCKHVDPRTVLEDGYCDGGSCTVNGKPWPSKFRRHLSE